MITASPPLGQAPFGTACAPDKNHDDNNDDDDGDDGGEEEDVSASNEGDVQVSQCRGGGDVAINVLATTQH